MARGKQPKLDGHGNILNSVIIHVCSDDFDIHLPDIHHRTWATILSAQAGPTRDQNERLEYMGDSLMYFCVALELFERYPTASPGFMTIVRQPLVTNILFSLLAEKIDKRAAKKGSILQPITALKKCAYKVSKKKKARAEIPQNMVKAAADTLEMVIGALFVEKGLPAVRQWVSSTFEPLIETAVEAYDKYHKTSHEPASGLKRWRECCDETGLESNGSRPTKRPRMELRVPATRTAGSSNVQGPSSTAATCSIADDRIVIDLTQDSSDMEVDEHEDSDSDDLSDGPVVIDLTVSDDEDEGNAPNIRPGSLPTEPLRALTHDQKRIDRRDHGTAYRTVPRGSSPLLKPKMRRTKNTATRTSHNKSSSSRTVAGGMETDVEDDDIPGLNFATRAVRQSRTYTYQDRTNADTSDSSLDS